MSLLLDALKKAAQQKAEKSQEEELEGQSSDETLVVARKGHVSELEQADDSNSNYPARALEDETELDHSKLETRLEQARQQGDDIDETGLDVSQIDQDPDSDYQASPAPLQDADETQIEIAEETLTQSHLLDAQMHSGEDETIIFAEEDASEIVVESESISLPARSPDDETDLSQLAGTDDETDLGQLAGTGDETDSSQLAGTDDETDLSQLAGTDDETDLSGIDDETDLGQLAGTGDETDSSRLAGTDDETDLSQLAGTDDETDLGQLAGTDDETDLSQLAGTDDATDLGRLAGTDDETDSSQLAGTDDETDSSQLAGSDDETDQSLAQRTPGDETDPSQPVDAPLDEDPSLVAYDHDMSLMLVPHDDTDISARTSPTDTESPATRSRFLRKDSTLIDAAMGLVDITRESKSADSTNTNQSGAEHTQTTGVTRNTGAIEEGTLTRAEGGPAEATSTRTYAPDNYDRTLMKLPSEDASKLFSGMSSDDDVLMTPEYAKKVFTSKSSAKRIHYYKIYAGITVAILLTIGIYGLFEYQDQSTNIGASLQPLKYDPLPGVIKSTNIEEPSALFADAGETGPEVDSRTIEMIENAQVHSEGVIAAEETEAITVAVVEEAVEAEDVVEVEVIQPITQNQASQVAKLDAEPAPVEEQPAEAETPTSTLQITSSQRVSQKNILLREAYAAYQSGDDVVALGKYNQVLELDPGNRNALLARAAISVHNNKSAAAIRDYRTLLLANPKDSLAMASLVTVAHFLPRETETQLKLMIREEPESPYLNFALGNVYGAQDRWLEAQGLYFKALENNPEDPNYAYNLAVSLEHISKPKVAITYYQRALDNFEKGLATFSRNVVDQRLEILRKL